jgi:flagellar biosynthesis/type III secretory pathway protein FliH
MLMVRETHPAEKFMPANNDEPQLAYTVQEHNARFEICAASGRVVLVCEDEGSAAHYAALLNEAHKAGYKLGYRDGRNK